MAHFAKLNNDNEVIEVHVVSNEVLDSNNEEASGIAFLTELFGGNWKQTSYNTSFRKNYAGIGHTYDPERDAFIPIKSYPSWILNEETCQWESPVPKPNDDKLYVWNEDSLKWDEIVI